MKRPTISRNFKNSIANFLDVFLYPVLFFVFTPFFIDRLGEKSFGVWILVNSIMISMQVFNLGLGTAVLKNVAKYLGSGEKIKIVSTINTNFSLSCIIHLVCILAGAFLGVGIRYFSFFNIESEFVNLASAGAMLGGVMVGFKFYEQIISYTFKAFERFDIAAFINSGIRLAILFVNILLVYLGYGLLILLVVNILFSLVGVFIGFVMIKSYLPDFKFRLQLTKANVSKELTFALWTWFQSLAIIITFQFDRFFVVTEMGLKTLTYYGLVATMFNHIHMGFNSIVPWLAPKITKMQARGRDVTELYYRSRNISLLLGLSALMVFSLVNVPVFRALLDDEKFSNTQSFIEMFTLFELFFVYAIVPGYFLNAAGHEKLYFKVVLFYCGCIITGMLTGYYLLHNATGLLAGMIVATAITMIVQNQIINNIIFKQKGITDSLQLFSPVFVIALMVITTNPYLKAGLFTLSVVVLYTVFIKVYQLKFSRE
ncbi:MAG: oligosaccharide flippase family protein [Bacteroidota bacterium]